MPHFEQLSIDIDVDAVIRGQGADPAILKARRPALVALAEKAMEEALPLVEPAVYYRPYAVEAVRHERILLEGGYELRGKLTAQHLGRAKTIWVILCSIGQSLEQFGQEIWESSPVYSLAIDGVGSAVVEALANAACRHLEIEAANQGWKSSIPLSPGMTDWSVEEGQPQIFKLLEGEPLGVRLTESFIMLPRKSLTMVVGAGPDLEMTGRTCDYCNLRDVCRYQDHYI